MTSGADPFAAMARLRRMPVPPRFAEAPTPAGPLAGFPDPAALPELALSLLSACAGVIASRQLPLQRRVLSDGTRCALPIRYYDAYCVIATFAAARDRADAVLREAGLPPAAGAGPATVLFGAFEYRDSDLGPYNEVGLSILAQAPGDILPALAVVDLPVTTQETYRIGVELWGYPKFVADIAVEHDAGGANARLADRAGRVIATLAGGFGPMVSTPPVDLPTYTQKDGRWLRTRIAPATPIESGPGLGLTLRVGDSAHPMTRRLRALGLDGARPIAVQRGDPFQALLYPGFAV